MGGRAAGSPFDGRSLGELRIRSTTGASVVGIIRDGSLSRTLTGRRDWKRETSSRCSGRAIRSRASNKRCAATAGHRRNASHRSD